MTEYEVMKTAFEREGYYVEPVNNECGTKNLIVDFTWTSMEMNFDENWKFAG